MARFCCMGAKRGEWKEKTKYRCNERRWEWLVDVWSRINWQNVLRHKLGVDDTAIYSAMQRNRIRWYGHVLRKDDEEWVNNLCTTFEGRTKRKNISLILTEYRLLSSQSNGCVLFGCFRRVHDHMQWRLFLPDHMIVVYGGAKCLQRCWIRCLRYFRLITQWSVIRSIPTLTALQTAEQGRILRCTWKDPYSLPWHAVCRLLYFLNKIDFDNRQ